MYQDHPCPKCHRLLRCRGEVTIAGRPPMPVYQCEECLDVWRFGKRSLETPLTFAVDSDGSIIGVGDENVRV